MNYVFVNINASGHGRFFVSNENNCVITLKVSLENNLLIIHYTRVNHATTNQEISRLSNKLLKVVVEYARMHSIKIIVSSAFIRKEFKKHPTMYVDVWERE